MLDERELVILDFSVVSLFSGGAASLEVGASAIFGDGEGGNGAAGFVAGSEGAGVEGGRLKGSDVACGALSSFAQAIS